jgi:hypothetical protein
MDERDLYLIGELPGFAPQIGRLVSMMNYARHTTLAAVTNLTVEELDSSGTKSTTEGRFAGCGHVPPRGREYLRLLCFGNSVCRL